MDDRNGVMQQAGYVVRYAILNCFVYCVLFAVCAIVQFTAVWPITMHSHSAWKLKWILMGFPFFLPNSIQHRITNDAREGEMEENMGQVNTMIGNVFFHFRYTAKLIWKKKTKFFFHQLAKFDEWTEWHVTRVRQQFGVKSFWFFY